jgi:hypothetical protein
MAKKRGTETVGDMVRSLAVVLLPLAFIVGVVLVQTPEQPTVRDVDTAAAVDAARQAAPFAVLAPSDLPEGWTTTQVSYRPGESDGSGTWRLDHLSDEGSYVGLVQSSGEVERLVAAELVGFEADGQSVVDGQTWQRLVEQGSGVPDRALVADVGDSVVLVRGPGDYAELESFVSRLR